MQIKKYILPFIITVAFALLLSFNTPPGFNTKGYGFPFPFYSIVFNDSPPYGSSSNIHVDMLIFDLILWTIFGVVLSKIGINKYIPAIIVVIAVFLGISYLFPVEDEYQKLYGFPQAFYRIYKDTGLPEGFVSFFIFYFILDLIAWMFVGIILGKTISFFRRK